jgi:hypothetical protein
MCEPKSRSCLALMGFPDILQRHDPRFVGSGRPIGFPFDSGRPLHNFRFPNQLLEVRSLANPLHSKLPAYFSVFLKSSFAKLREIAYYTADK